jgi:hypothetical protein
VAQTEGECEPAMVGRPAPLSLVEGRLQEEARQHRLQPPREMYLVGPQEVPLLLVVVVRLDLIGFLELYNMRS